MLLWYCRCCCCGTAATAVCGTAATAVCGTAATAVAALPLLLFAVPPLRLFAVPPLRLFAVLPSRPCCCYREAPCGTPDKHQNTTDAKVIQLVSSRQCKALVQGTSSTHALLLVWSHRYTQHAVAQANSRKYEHDPGPAECNRVHVHLRTACGVTKP